MATRDRRDKEDQKNTNAETQRKIDRERRKKLADRAQEKIDGAKKKKDGRANLTREEAEAWVAENSDLDGSVSSDSVDDADRLIANSKADYNKIQQARRKKYGPDADVHPADRGPKPTTPNKRSTNAVEGGRKASAPKKAPSQSQPPDSRNSSANAADRRRENLSQPYDRDLADPTKPYVWDTGAGNTSPSMRDSPSHAAIQSWIDKEGRRHEGFTRPNEEALGQLLRLDAERQKALEERNKHKDKDKKEVFKPNPAIAKYTAGKPKDGMVWLGSTGGVVAPARGHMNDPDAPGGRLAPPETDNLMEIKQAFSLVRKWSPAKLKEFQKLQGLTPSGEWGQQTQTAWQNVVLAAAAAWEGGRKVSPYDLMGLKSSHDAPVKVPGDGVGGPGGPGGGPKTSVDTVLTNRGAAKRLLNALFRENLGRAVTEDEVSKFQSMLNEQEKKHPTKTVTQMNLDGTEGTSDQSGGMSAEQYGEDYMHSVMGGEVNARNVGIHYFDAALDAIGAALH